MKKRNSYICKKCKNEIYSNYNRSSKSKSVNEKEFINKSLILKFD